MDIDHLSRRLRADPGPGRADRDRRTPSAAARTSTSPRRCARPSETFERRDHRPDDGPDRRMWPAPISRARARPLLRARRGRAARAAGRPGTRSRSPAGCGRRRSRRRATRCDRVPLAIDPERCVNAKWCHTGCIFGAKNSLITNYLRRGRARRASRSGPAARSSWCASRAARPYRYVVSAVGDRQRRPEPTRQPTGHRGDRVQGADPGRRRDGHAAAADALAGRAARRSPTSVGKHLGVNGDHVAAIEYDPAKVRSVLGAARLRRVLQGQADHHDDLRLLGRPRRPRLRRHALHAPGDLPVARSRTSSTTTAAPRAIRPGGGSQKKRRSRPGPTTSSCWRWSRTRTTASSTLPPPAGGAVRPNAGPIGVGPFNYTFSDAVAARARRRRTRRCARWSSAAAWRAS